MIDIKNSEKEFMIPEHLLLIEAMLEVSIKLQSQIIANQENKDFSLLVKQAFASVDETQKAIFQDLPDAKLKS